MFSNIFNDYTQMIDELTCTDPVLWQTEYICQNKINVVIRGDLHKELLGNTFFHGKKSKPYWKFNNFFDFNHPLVLKQM